MNSLIPAVTISTALLLGACGGGGGGGGGGGPSLPDPTATIDDPTADIESPPAAEQPLPTATGSQVEIVDYQLIVEHDSSMDYSHLVSGNGSDLLLVVSKEIDIAGNPVDVESYRFTSAQGWSTDAETVIPRPNNSVYSSEYPGLMFSDGTATLPPYKEIDGPFRSDLLPGFIYSPTTGWNSLGDEPKASPYNRETLSSNDTFTRPIGYEVNNYGALIGHPTARHFIVFDKQSNEIARTTVWHDQDVGRDGWYTTHPSVNRDTSQIGSMVTHKQLENGLIGGIFSYTYVYSEPPRPGDEPAEALQYFYIYRTIDTVGGTWSNPVVLFESVPYFIGDRSTDHTIDYSINEHGDVVSVAKIDQPNSYSNTSSTFNVTMFIDGEKTEHVLPACLDCGQDVSVNIDNLANASVFAGGFMSMSSAGGGWSQFTRLNDVQAPEDCQNKSNVVFGVTYSRTGNALHRGRILCNTVRTIDYYRKFDAVQRTWSPIYTITTGPKYFSSSVNDDGQVVIVIDNGSPTKFFSFTL